MKTITTIILCFICSVSCYSQKRATIDRTKKTDGTTIKHTGSGIKKNNVPKKVKGKSKQVARNKQQTKASNHRNTLYLSTDYLSFPDTGGSQAITVSSSSSWRIGTRTYDWGHLSVSGNTIYVRLDANTSSSSRTDYFTVKSGNVERRINISQSGKPIVYYSRTDNYLKVDGSTSNKRKYFGESGGREYYSVSTSSSTYETWGVPSWCSIENKTSSGFTLVCEKNPYRTSRSDYMKVMAAGKEIRINIEQEAKSGPSASITSVEQVHNVVNGYQKGMNINLKFNVSGMYGRKIKATAWFYYADNTTQLHNAYGGQVNVSKSMNINYEDAVCTMTLFMPYLGLNMMPGFNGYLSFDVIISDSSGNRLARQDNNSFMISNY